MKNRTTGSNHNAALLSLTLTVAAAGTLYLVTLDAMALAMARDAHVIADVAGHTALGIFFRLQVTDVDRLLGFFSLCHSKSLNERGSIVEK
jgi:hypothetical protein